MYGLWIELWIMDYRSPTYRYGRLLQHNYALSTYQGYRTLFEGSVTMISTISNSSTQSSIYLIDWINQSCHSSNWVLCPKSQVSSFNHLIFDFWYLKLKLKIIFIFIFLFLIVLYLMIDYIMFSDFFIITFDILIFFYSDIFSGYWIFE